MNKSTAVSRGARRDGVDVNDDDVVSRWRGRSNNCTSSPLRSTVEVIVLG
jgi:hypothetical protein